MSKEIEALTYYQTENEAPSAKRIPPRLLTWEEGIPDDLLCEQILEKLGIVAETSSINKPFIIEVAHPYVLIETPEEIAHRYFSLEGPNGPTLRIAQKLRKKVEEREGKALIAAFIDDITPTSERKDYCNRITPIGNQKILTYVRDSVTVGSDIVTTDFGKASPVDLMIPESRFRPQAHELIMALRNSSALQTGGERRLRFKGLGKNMDVYHFGPNDFDPSCEMFDLAWRQTMGLGVVFLPETFRRLQQRVEGLENALKRPVNVVTVLTPR